MAREAQLAALLAKAIDYSESVTLENDPLPPFVAEAKAILAQLEGQRLYEVRMVRAKISYEVAVIDVAARNESEAIDKAREEYDAGDLTWRDEPSGQDTGAVDVECGGTSTRWDD